VSELFDVLLAGNADGRAGCARASWHGVATRRLGARAGSRRRPEGHRRRRLVARRRSGAGRRLGRR